MSGEVKQLPTGRISKEAKKNLIPQQILLEILLAPQIVLKHERVSNFQVCLPDSDSKADQGVDETDPRKSRACRVTYNTLQDHLAHSQSQ